MRDFTNLTTWQRAHRLVLEIYKETRSFPPEERYGLTNQVRRSAASVPANIAEGAGRRTDTDFARFVDYALGSVNETQYHLLLARDLGLITSETHERLVGELREIRMMTGALAQRLREQQHSKPTRADS